MNWRAMRALLPPLMEHVQEKSLALFRFEHATMMKGRSARLNCERRM
jgi:hypothetical protein